MEQSRSHHLPHLYNYLRPDIEIIHSVSAHERHLAVRVSVDAPRYDQTACGVNGPRPARDIQIEANLLYDLVLNVHIRSLSSILVDDLSSFDEDPDNTRYEKKGRTSV